MIRLLRIAAVCLLLAYTVAFVLTNGDLVTVRLPPFSGHDLPGWLVAVIAGAVGALVTALWLSWPLVRLRAQVRRDGKRIARLEEELHGLRTLPLESGRAGPVAPARSESFEASPPSV